MHILAEQCRDQGKAVVMVSHDINLAYQVATHAFVNDAQWSNHAWAEAEVMTAGRLEDCLGHPIERFEHGQQILFMPSVAV